MCQKIVQDLPSSTSGDIRYFQTFSSKTILLNILKYLKATNSRPYKSKYLFVRQIPVDQIGLMKF